MIAQAENRGTGFAIATATLMLRDLDSEAIVAAFPRNHHYSNEAAFLDVIEAGILVAQNNSDAIVLLGAEATDPETEYGWIGAGPAGRERPAACARTSPSILGEANSCNCAGSPAARLPLEHVRDHRTRQHVYRGAMSGGAECNACVVRRHPGERSRFILSIHPVHRLLSGRPRFSTRTPCGDSRHDVGVDGSWKSESSFRHSQTSKDRAGLARADSLRREGCDG